MVREHRWIECGRAGRPFGVRGELVVDWSGGTCPVEAGTGAIYIHKGGDEYRPFVVLSSRRHGKRHVVRIEGFATRADAEVLRNEIFFLREEQLEDPGDDQYYIYQIIGLEVVTSEGRLLGTITDIQKTGANDVYEVTPLDGDRKRSFYIPAVDHVVVSIDVEANKMVINLIKGLI